MQARLALSHTGLEGQARRRQNVWREPSVRRAIFGAFDGCLRFGACGGGTSRPAVICLYTKYPGK
jgi:hypothetical protein